MMVNCYENRAEVGRRKIGFPPEQALLAQKALTGNNEEGTMPYKVTKIVINGVWDGQVCFPQDG
jgi:hypothetical protein